MLTLFKKLKAEAHGAAGLHGATYRVYTTSGKPRAGRYGGIRRPHRRKDTTDHRTRTSGARNDSATPATAAAEKRHGVA
jgi:hypothetical protein